MTKYPRFFSVAITSSFFVALCCAGPATAGSQNPSYTINTTVTGACQSISATYNNQSASSYAIGTNYDPFTYPTGNPLRNTTALVLSTYCTQGDSISWSVGIGNNCNRATGIGGPTNDRAMSDSASPTPHYLAYELYSNSTFTTSYGTSNCGTPVAVTDTGKGSGTANTISIFGQVPGGQNAFVGTSGTTSYSDTVTVTLSY